MNEAFPSKYMRAGVEVCDEQPIIVTISGLEMEEVGQDRESKPVIFFKEFDKGMVLNKTNASIISKLYGDDSDDWDGKKVTLYATEVQFNKDMVAAIRIKSTIPKAKAKAAAELVEDDVEIPF